MRSDRSRRSLSLDAIENAGLYLGIVVLLAVDFAGQYVSWIPAGFSKTAAPFYVGLLLLARLVLKKMEHLQSYLLPEGHQSLDFNGEIRGCLMRHQQTETIDILATNSRKFYHAVEDVSFHTTRVRILIYEKTPGLDEIAQRWESLREKGRFTHLEIRSYSFTPMFYGVSIDRKEGYFGFFDPEFMANPERSLAVMQVTGPYWLSPVNSSGRNILADIERWFDVTFEHYSASVHSSSATPPRGGSSSPS